MQRTLFDKRAQTFRRYERGSGVSDDDVYRFPGLQRYEREAQRSTHDGNWYDTAQICLNGHTVTAALVDFPERGQKYCHECGAPTITACPSCGASIHGYFHRTDIVIWGGTYVAPNHCHECGTMYPWTAEKLEAARALTDELALTDDEKKTIKDSLPEIVQDTPRAQASAFTLKRLLSKAEIAGSVAVGTLRALVVDISAKAIAEIIKGPQP